MILGREISYKKEGKEILHNVSFELPAQRITIFMGSSGAGKTSLLRCIGNLVTDYTGSITYLGEDLRSFVGSRRATTVGFVFQQFHLFPHLTVLHNCTYALIEGLGETPAEARKRAEEILVSLGLRHLLHAYPKQLSGGQQQRVAIARALLLSPQYLLLDEPTSSLDPESKKQLGQLLVEVQKKGVTLVLASHDMPFIRKIKDRIYYMENGSIVEACDCHMQDPRETQSIRSFLFDSEG